MLLSVQRTLLLPQNNYCTQVVWQKQQKQQWNRLSGGFWMFAIASSLIWQQIWFCNICTQLDDEILYRTESIAFSCSPMHKIWTGIYHKNFACELKTKTKKLGGIIQLNNNRKVIYFFFLFELFLEPENTATTDNRMSFHRFSHASCALMRRARPGVSDVIKLLC